jgi:hypothetical protein
MTANNKATESQVTLNASTESEIELSLNLHKECSFLVEDILAAQSKPAIREKYTSNAGYVIAKAIDSSLTGLYSGLSQSVGPITASHTSAEIDAFILDAVKYLNTADAPDMDRSFVFHPQLERLLMKVDSYKNLQYQPQTPVATGQLGTLYGHRAFRSSNIASTTVSAVTTYHNLLFQKGVFGVAFQLGPRTQANYIPQYLGWLVTVDVIYGVVELRDTFGVDVQCT